MAKKKQDAARSNAADIDRSSPLGRAYAAYVAGDMVAARALAQQVLASGGTDEDTALVAKLGEELDLQAPLAAHVAADLVSRSSSPTKVFVFAAAALAVLTLLVTLARTRY